MAKKVQGYVKLQVPAGSANPSPPIGRSFQVSKCGISIICSSISANVKNVAWWGNPNVAISLVRYLDNDVPTSITVLSGEAEAVFNKATRMFAPFSGNSHTCIMCGLFARRPRFGFTLR